MPVVVASKRAYVGTVSPPGLGVETTVIDVPAQDDDYLVEGYVDLSSLQPGDSVTVTEYVSVDGTNLRAFARYSFDGPLSMPVYRFHTKTLLKHMLYRVTVTQTSGTLKSFPYAFIVEVLGTL